MDKSNSTTAQQIGHCTHPVESTPYTKEAARAQFESWSRTYDGSILQWLLFTPSHNCLMERIDGTRAFRILDIGCGTGVFAERIRRQFSQAEIWAVDLTHGMIEHASRRSAEFGLAVNCVQADSESLPLADNSFDVITCSNSFHHYPNQQQAVCEMHRVLRPEGRLMIIDGYRDRLWGRIIFDWCVATVEGAVHHASAQRFRDLFVQAGFSDVRQQAKLGLAPFLLTTGVALKPAGWPGLRGCHPTALVPEQARALLLADAVGVRTPLRMPLP